MHESARATVSELKSLGILNTCFIFLPFCSHALGKIISCSVLWLSSNSLSTLAGICWCPLKLCSWSRHKDLFIVRFSENVCTSLISFSAWGYWNIPSPWNCSSTVFLLSPWHSLSSYFSGALYSLNVGIASGWHQMLCFLIVNGPSGGAPSCSWHQQQITVLKRPYIINLCPTACWTSLFKCPQCHLKFNTSKEETF